MEPVLSRLKIKNFKSIGDPGIDLELKPLTILVGPNGAGKSSILEALALLSANVEQEEFRLKGELTQSFDTPQQIAHKHELSRWITWEIHLPDAAGIRYEYRLDSAEKRETIIKAGTDVYQQSLQGDTRRGHSLVTAIPGRMEVILGNMLLPLAESKYRYDLYDVTRKSELAKLVPEGELRPLLDSAASTVSKVANTLRDRLFLLTNLRGQVPSRANAGATPRWIGTKGENLIPILNVLHGSSEATWELMFSNIQKWAREFGLFKLKPGLQPTGTLGVWYLDSALKAPMELAFAGYGSRQIVSVITQLFWALPDSVVMIEEPEISLHPEAQVKLGELFADAILENKQIIATTHSHFLLLALSRAVEKGLKVDDIAVYHVTKGKEGTDAKPVKLSKRGYPLGWPPSYEKVERDIALNWAKDLAKE